MKTGWLLALTAAAGLLVAAPADAQEAYDYSYARLSYVRGDVFIQRGADLGYEKGEVNFALMEGDRLGTKDGQAEVHFGRRNYLRAGEETQLELAVLPRQGDDRVRVQLYDGRIYLRVSRLERAKDFEIHTPDASFYVLEAGLYRLDVRDGAETELAVVEGAMEAAGEEGSVEVERGRRIVAANGRLESEAAAYFGGERDDFDRWNSTRDELLALRTSERYLPTELEEYESELSQNGRWAYERPYGYVWVPHVSALDWRPYYYGRWVWYPVIGWTWVSSEPWGWSVYHYGRWHWRFGLGWYWIPQARWAGAWVHWCWDGPYVGWSPLSWYNRPVVIVNNNFYDRYYDSYHPARSRALTIVHRDRLQSPAIHRAALRGSELTSLNRLSLRGRQPEVRPSISRTSLQADSGRTIFQKSAVRQASLRTFGSGGALSPQRLGSPSLRTGGRLPGESSTGRSGGAVSPGSLRDRSADRAPASAAGENRPAGRGVVSRGSLSGGSRDDSGAAPAERRTLSRPQGRESEAPSGLTRRGSPESIRVYPSRRGDSSGAPARGSVSSGQVRRSDESRDAAPARSTVRSFPARTSGGSRSSEEARPASPVNRSGAESRTTAPSLRKESAAPPRSAAAAGRSVSSGRSGAADYPSRVNRAPRSSQAPASSGSVPQSRSLRSASPRPRGGEVRSSSSIRAPEAARSFAAPRAPSAPRSFSAPRSSGTPRTSVAPQSRGGAPRASSPARSIGSARSAAPRASSAPRVSGRSGGSSAPSRSSSSSSSRGGSIRKK